MKNINRKLRSNSGESMAETLISLLIAALGILLLAGMIQASSNLITTSNEKFREYVNNENTVIEKTGSAASGQASLTDIENNPIKFNKDEQYSYIIIEYYEMELGNKKVVSFRKDD